MEATIIGDIWSQLEQTIDLVLMITIIACGYLVGRAGLFGQAFAKLRTTTKVLIVTIPVTVLYAIYQETPPGVAIASFFIAFGFHTIVLKWIDRWVEKLTSTKEKS